MLSGGVSGLFAAHQLLKEGTPRVLLLEVSLPIILSIKLNEGWFLGYIYVTANVQSQLMYKLAS